MAPRGESQEGLGAMPGQRQCPLPLGSTQREKKPVPAPGPLSRRRSAPDRSCCTQARRPGPHTKGAPATISHQRAGPGPATRQASGQAERQTRCSPPRRLSHQEGRSPSQVPVQATPCSPLPQVPAVFTYVDKHLPGLLVRVTEESVPVGGHSEAWGPQRQGAQLPSQLRVNTLASAAHWVCPCRNAWHWPCRTACGQPAWTVTLGSVSRARQPQDRLLRARVSCRDSDTPHLASPPTPGNVRAGGGSELLPADWSSEPTPVPRALRGQGRCNTPRGGGRPTATQGTRFLTELHAAILNQHREAAFNGTFTQHAET